SMFTNDTIDDLIDRLFTSAYAGIDSAIEGAAFQIALWEIITDGGPSFIADGGPFYSLTGDKFRASEDTGVIEQANSYLAALAGASTGGYKITYLNSSDSQDLVTVSAVPVPAALGMLGLGVASFFGLRRRKKS
ncbi:MAG: VPLPA-CTERM sorting domain-containing protein, partial [Paracoccaceae bacterium]